MSARRGILAGAAGGALAVALLATGVQAALECVPLKSRVEEPLLLVCPGGDIGFHTQALDAALNPVPNSTIEVEWTTGSVRVGEPRAGDLWRTVAGRPVVFMVTDAQGRATFPLRAGGACVGSATALRADGVPFATRTTVSPDQNGDLVVNVVDLSLLIARMFSRSYVEEADLDGNDDVGAHDLAILLRHLGHRG